MTRLLVFLLGVCSVQGFVIPFGTRRPNIVLDGPYCHSCEMIINNVKYDYKQNFKHVTPQQLLGTLDQECDNNFGGEINQQCRAISAANVNVILFDLQQGHTAYYICLTIDPPLC